MLILCQSQMLSCYYLFKEAFRPFPNVANSGQENAMFLLALTFRLPCSNRQMFTITFFTFKKGSGLRLAEAPRHPHLT